MSYAAALDRLHTLGQELAPTPAGAPRRKFDLAHMRTLCAALGDPQDRFPSILIAGTNGKGSTAATLAGILTAAGYRTALYTSPHLRRVNERIQLSSLSAPGSPLTEIPDDDFARLYFLVDDTAQRLVSTGQLPHSPSFFETLTAIAFLYFAEHHAEIAVLEVGLGGRLDATNIVHPILSILTDIAIDHTDYLGPTIPHIAREKCGILRSGGALITLPQHPESNQAIGEAATALNVHAISAGPFVPHTPRPLSAFSSAGNQESPLPRNCYTVTLGGEPLAIDSPLAGEHQRRNIALAIAAAEHLRNPESYNLSENRPTRNQSSYNITNSSIEAGIRDTHWPGRLEFLPPNLLLDVAHNPAGAWSLRAAIAQLPDDHPRTLLFSCLHDKNLAEMTQILFPLFDATGSDLSRARDHIVLAPIANPRASTIDDLLAAAHALDIPAHAAPHLAAALAQARQVTPADGLIVATGSIYLVGELRHLLITKPEDMQEARK